MLTSICKFLANQRIPLHSESVRGSPLVRFFILTCALAATGLGLMRVTSTENKLKNPTQSTDRQTVELEPVPFRLIVSSPASFVEIDTGKIVRPPPLDGPMSGKLEIDPKNPRVGLIVKWKNPISPGEHRFAKLTLEAPGKDTFTHTFDAAGDLDDFIELPLPETP